jgi:ATP-dependent exoDNAse (exonuclease V) beta subunit
MPQEFIEQKQRILKDVLYVALTRAVSELHVLGGERLSDIVSAIKS